MDRNVNNEKELKPLSSNGLSRMGGGLEQPLIHPEGIVFTDRHPETFSSRHPGGFTDGRRVNESEPSPVSEQIEHTKTESLYAKLCEREVNPRQLVSGSYQSGDYTLSRSDSEHTACKQPP